MEKKLLASLSAGLLLLGMSGMASALTLSTVSGTWTGTTGGSNVATQTAASTYGNGFENQIHWGNAATGAGQSGLGFTGAATNSVFNIDDPFELGQLQHFNNPIYSNTAASEAFLTINLSFSDPTGLAGSFDFSFAIDETPNGGGSPASDDHISFPSTFASQTFAISGVDYTLQILGFGITANSLVNSFTSPEGGTNATLLWGQITTPADPVPEPSTMLLMGAGLLGLVGVNRKRSSKKN